MILQKSARFLMICLCAIIFHGNVFGEDNCLTPGSGKKDGVCVPCDTDEYSFTIPATNSFAGSVPAHNICITEQGTMNCEDDVCTCKDGYYAGTDISKLCQKCSSGYFSNSTTGGKCTRCEEVIKTEDKLNVGCESCGEGEEPNSEHTSCVCKEGYGANDRGDCVKCGNGKTSVGSEDGGYECTVCETGVPQLLDNIYSGCVPCSEGFFPDETHTTCVQSCSGDGMGKFKEKGVIQCVKCSDNNMVLSGGECVNDCPNYQVKNNGECGYCEDGKVYSMVTKECIDTNSCPSLQGTSDELSVCCEEYKYFDQASEQCKSCDVNQYFDEGKCQDCPKNFSCDGRIKTKCEFGKVSEEGVGVCEVPDITNQGFFYNNGTEYEVITEKHIRNYQSSQDQNYLKGFEYAYCSNVNGVSKEGIFETVTVQICRECDKETRYPANGECVCGRISQKEGEPQVGLVEGIGEHKNVCQICPNGLSKTPEHSNYICNNGCPDTTPFYHWDGEKYICKESCPDDTALYIDKDGYGWCLTHEDLKIVKGEDEANRYYQNKQNNQPYYKWELCPAGHCCLGGKEFTCHRGTYSLVNGGLACNKEEGICLSCNGKTTKGEETACPYGEDKSNLCQTYVCTESITPTKFCVVSNNKDHSQDMCFEIDKIKMTLATGAGVYNTIDVSDQ